MNIFEEKIIAAVSDLYREAVVNELLLPITRKIHSGYRFEIKDKETISGLREYWEQLSEQELGESELSDKKLMRNLWRIFCRAVTVLSYLIEELSADGMPTIQEKYKEIKRYYQDYKKAWKKPIKTFSRKIQEIYNADRIAGLSETEISEVLDKAASEIQAELPKYSSGNQILVVYHYYRHHTAYNEETFKAFCKMLGMNEQQPKELIAFKTTKSVDEIMRGIKGKIYSEENLQEWYNQIYGNAKKKSQKYPSLSPIIPPKEHIAKLINKTIKAVYDDQVKQGNFRMGDGRDYVNTIFKTTKKKAIVPINKKGRTSHGLNGMELRTFHTFIEKISNTFGTESKQYSCPDFLYDEFMSLCEEYYNCIKNIAAKQKDKKSKEDKEKIKFIEVFSSVDYTKYLSKIYVCFFIISSFDKGVDAPKNKEAWLRNQLILLKIMVENKDEQWNNNYIEIIKDILKNWK